MSVRLTLLLKLWQIEPRTYIYLQRALESDFVPLNERNKLNYLIAKVNHVFLFTLYLCYLQVTLAKSELLGLENAGA